MYLQNMLGGKELNQLSAKKSSAGVLRLMKHLKRKKRGQLALVICSKCFSKIGKGYERDCSRRGKVSNIQNLLAATPTSAQRFTSRVVSG